MQATDNCDFNVLVISTTANLKQMELRLIAGRRH